MKVHNFYLAAQKNQGSDTAYSIFLFLFLLSFSSLSQHQMEFKNTQFRGEEMLLS